MHTKTIAKTAISLSWHSIKHLKFSSTRQQNRAKSPPNKANHISSTRGQNCKRQVDTADQVMAARPRMAWRRCAQCARSCSVGTKEGLQPMPRRCAGGSGTACGNGEKGKVNNQKLNTHGGHELALTVGIGSSSSAASTRACFAG